MAASFSRQQLSIMLVILPYLALLLLFVLFRRLGEDRRGAVLGAAVAWGVLLTGLTEVLSLFRLVTVTALGLSWLIACLALGAACILVGRKTTSGPAAEPAQAPRVAYWSVFAVAVLIVIPIGVTALVAPPNTWDSLTYHLTRVLYWVQNQSVAHYPTSELRQIYMQPGSEYVLLHFQLLSGGDRFANLMQWLSMVGSLVGVSLIARELGVAPPGQALAAVVCATIPIGILEASSSRNDYWVSFWLVGFVYYVLRWKARPTMFPLLAGGASLGLAMLGKAMAYTFAPPFFLLLGLRGFGTLLTRFWTGALLAVVLVMALNMGHFLRNYQLFGHPLRPDKETLAYEVTNEVFTPPAVLSGLIRGAAAHLIATPFEHVNQSVEQGVARLHALLGIDMNDPRTTFLPANEGFHAQPTEGAWSEDSAGSPVHFLLAAVCSALCPLSRRLRALPGLNSYAAALALGYVVFAAYVMFMMGTVRYQLTLLVLAAPLVAVVLTELTPRPMVELLTAVLILMALPYTFHNGARPLIGEHNIFVSRRNDLYFFNSPGANAYLAGLRASYQTAADYLRTQGHKRLGVIVEDYEYPFWVLYPEFLAEGGRFEQVNIEYPFGRMENSPGFRPSALVFIDPKRGFEKGELPWPESLDFAGRAYRRDWTTNGLSIFLRE